MNFDEYWSDGFNSYGDARDAAKDAWQEQQAKIDILQIKLNGADERAAAVLNHKNKMIDELQARIDEVLIEMKNQLGEEDYYDMERPDYDAMLYALRNIKDILIK